MHRAGYRGVVANLDATLSNPLATRADKGIAAHLKHQEAARRQRLVSEATKAGKLDSAKHKEEYQNIMRSKGSLGVKQYRNDTDEQIASKSARVLSGGDTSGSGLDTAVAEEMASEAMHRLRRRQSVDMDKRVGFRAADL